MIKNSPCPFITFHYSASNPFQWMQFFKKKLLRNTLQQEFFQHSTHKRLSQTSSFSSTNTFFQNTRIQNLKNSTFSRNLFSTIQIQQRLQGLQRLQRIQRLQGIQQQQKQYHYQDQQNKTPSSNGTFDSVFPDPSLYADDNVTIAGVSIGSTRRVGSPVIVPPTSTGSLPNSGTSSPFGVFVCVELDPTGASRMREIPRSELYAKFGLQGRDVRVLISSMNYPTVLARRRCILIDIKNLRGIICADRLYLLYSEGKDFKSLVSYIQGDLRYQHSVEYGHGIHQQQYFHYHQQKQSRSAESDGTETSSINDDSIFSYHQAPFEFQALESFLKKMCNDVIVEYQKFAHQVQVMLRNPQLGRDEENLYELLQVKNSINRFKTYVQEFHGAIEQLLESDEDMAAMYLSWKESNPSKSRPIDNHEEVEMLLETYYTLLEDILTRINEMNSDIQSTQEFQQISLDTIRNKMLRLELRITFAALAVSLAALIAGLFGMNLLSGLEQNGVAFYVVVSFAFLLITGIYLYLMRYSRAKGIFKTHSLYVEKRKIERKY